MASAYFMESRYRNPDDSLSTQHPSAAARPAKSEMMSLLVLSATDVDEVITKFDANELVDLMVKVFAALSAKSQQSMSAEHVSIPHRSTITSSRHNILFMPSRLPEIGTAIKIVSVPVASAPPEVKRRGLPASTMVIDDATGDVVAVVNARKLTALRNAASSLLATRILLPSDASPQSLVAVGAGAQIFAHIALFLSAYPSIRTCKVFNRTFNDRLNKLLVTLRAQHPSVTIDGYQLTEDIVYANAIREANIIITATSATVPLFPASYVSPGTHLCLIGSYTPTMHEIDSELVRRAGKIVVDYKEGAMAEAGELIAANVSSTDILELGEMISTYPLGASPGWAVEPSKVRQVRESGDVTIFKSVGVGVQDVAIAHAVVACAKSLELVRAFDDINVADMPEYTWRNTNPLYQPPPFPWIHNLPVEIILRMFTLSIRAPPFQSGDFKGVLYLSHVCSRWRVIMWANAAPWRTVYLDDLSTRPELAAFWIERSGNVPLIILPGYNSSDPWQKEFVRKHLHRIQSLNVAVAWYDSAECYNQWFTESDAPNMQDFTCDFYIPTDPDKLDLDVLPHIFGGSARALRHLSLSYYRLAYTPRNYRNLTTLWLHSISVHSWFPGEGNILTAIQSSPKLEKLVITCGKCKERLDYHGPCEEWDVVTDTLPPPPAPQDRRHRLNRLRSLELSLPLPYLLLILGSVSLPEPEVLHSLKIDLCVPSPAVMSRFQLASILSPDYLPPSFLQNVRSCDIRSWVQWTCYTLNIHAKGVSSRNDDRYTVDVRFEIPKSFAENIQGVLEAFTTRTSGTLTFVSFDLVIGSFYAGEVAEFAGCTAAVLALLSRCPSVTAVTTSDNINLWFDNKSLYFYGHEEVDPDLFKHIEHLDVKLPWGWNYQTLDYLAWFCKNIPRLKTLTLRCEYTYYFLRDEDTCREVVGTLKDLGLNAAIRHVDEWTYQIDVDIDGPVDLGLFLTRIEDVERFEPALEVLFAQLGSGW
ncbi:hypothetical protein NM688_g7720 [Phlebia brevispora]|uniref:Uncharacterized protein n=1 Tax=Phlebia brevispora TaxID=194682 RepID=A0ACC1S1V2_9APHY|nr:hypothetical protein NM688_g7720 [Phlebia brevispora]